MRFPLTHLMAATALALSLSACVVDDTVSMAANQPTAAVPLNDAAHYAAVPDADFTVPAVPVEKVPAEFQRQTVAYDTDQPVGTIIIDPGAKHLYLITDRNHAVRYGISVGRSGFGWSGEADITNRTTWPTWTPPAEMIARRPELAKFKDGEPGGLENPLGARALYLKTNGVDYGYRIHGTPEWNTIGHNASSGCIRMINQDVMDLYNRVPDGTHVVVLNEDGSFPTKLTVPPVQKPAKKATSPTTPPPPTSVEEEPTSTNNPVYGPL
ncbi:MAG: L,D-transpeptidase [Paracoccaceae bacterium]